MAVSPSKSHAKFSASGSDRWLNCPGSIALSEKAPPQKESEYALEGTKAHECLDFILKNGNTEISEEAAIRVVTHNYPSEMVEHGIEAAHWIRAKLSQFPGAELLTDTRVDASPFTTEGQFGTLDAAIVEPFGRLTVIDYKYGAGIAVDPEENSQLIYYALGISHQFHHNFMDVELVIIQPRAFHPSGNTVRSCVISMEEFLAWNLKFFAGVTDALEKDARLSSGKWCKFCPAAVICPEIKNQALKRAKIVFKEDQGLALSDLPQAPSIAIKNLPEILKATYLLEDWISHVRSHAFEVLKRGEYLKGFKLVERRPTRKWRDEQAVAAEAQTLFKGGFSAPKLLSPAQFEKACPSSGQWVASRTELKSSGYTLAGFDDKRPAINIKTCAFSIVEETEAKPEKVSPKKSKST